MAATDFAGYLIKNDNNVAFPLKYIDFSSWDSTPNQREEIKAERDDNTRDLIRVTAQGKKSVIHFKTRPNLTLAEKIEIQTFFTSGESAQSHTGDAAQRKIYLTYWNDEDNIYKSNYFYRPDIKFTIKKIENNTIIYDAIEIDLIEY